MSNNLFYILSLIIALSSCTNNDIEGDNNPPTSEASKKLPVAPNFSWNTLESEQLVISANGSSVYEIQKDGQEVLLAEQLPAGTYSFTHIKPGSAFDVRPASAAKNQSATKASSAESASYFPAQGRYAMMMVEDVFPNLGDLDMNDIIINFGIKYILQSAGTAGESPSVDALEITIKPLAAGGTLYSKIGIALNFVQNGSGKTPPVKSVNGQLLSNGMFGINGQGSEDGYIVPLCDDYRSLFAGATSDKEIINTMNNLPKLDSKTFTVRIELEPGVKLNDIQTDPDAKGNMLDLFVTLGERGREVHLKGHPATHKLNAEFTKYGNYASTENWVWALILPDEIKYSKEGTPLYEAYPYFKDWVQGKLNNIDEWTFYHAFDKIYR